jgi:membrane-bound metal-dependent hydrolase YbcI (DUF457 family)
MTLRELLMAISFLSPFANAFGTGWQQGGMYAIVVGILIGLLAGVACAYGTSALYAGLARIERKNFPDSKWQIVIGVLFFVGVGIWLLGVTAFAGAGTRRFSIR